MSFQQTITRAVALEGIGLHSGCPAKITVAPGRANGGIVFKVAGPQVKIPARASSIVDSHYATTLGVNGTRIQTVEHLLAAAAGLGLDNLEVSVEGTEIPAADGSAQPFVALLRAAGRATLAARRHPIVIGHPIHVGTDGRWLRIVPADAFRISYTLDSPHPAVGTQVVTCEPTERVFVEELAPARTYGFLKDLGQLRRSGLARGGSLDNAVVVGKRGVLNGLRYRDEFVRHKILDLIGDLALLGRPILGHVIARNAGHTLNFELVTAIERAYGAERRALWPLPGLSPRPVDLRPAPGVAAL